MDLDVQDAKFKWPISLMSVERHLDIHIPRISFSLKSKEDVMGK